MEKINPLALIGCKSLNYDLFDEKGQVLYRAGEELTSGFLLMLNYKDTYKEEEPYKLPEPNSNLYSEKEREISIIPQDLSGLLINNAYTILSGIAEGNPPDPELCEETSEVIVDMVNDKIDKVECVNQLRVFDEYTFSHTINVCSLSTALAIKCGFDKQDVKDLSLGTLMHDIGKMKISKTILNKPGKLDSEEFEVIKKHSMYGYNILVNEMKIPEKIAIVAQQHHEKYSGKGYPFGLKGDEINYLAQICSIADVYDALVSKRPYKDPFPSYEALKIMVQDGSFSFNPKILFKFVYIANYKNPTNFVIS